MRYPLLIIGLSLATGIAIGLISHDYAAQSFTAPPDRVTVGTVANGDLQTANGPGADITADGLEELNRRLQNEIIARIAFENKLAELNQKILQLELKAQLSVETTSTASIDGIDDSNLPTSGQGWMNEQALIDSGMDSGLANTLKTRFEQLELDRLYLRDQSIREGWDRDRYREALQTLTSKEDEFKNQLSESEYDSYLYASGQTNRVAVTSVLESAPAAAAGIEPGDHIIRYDNQRIYNWFELREATSTGEIGEAIAVEVERDGDIIELYLARGPLGIRMNSVSIAP
ncbi:MAG: PDZ domain-containing protein [Gammaproteobacteria bacterium]|nr:PDZ domain-containing protein [Gammaproteobacteria bacterium]